MTSPNTHSFPVTLRELTVLSTIDLTPQMRRIILGGSQLGAFEGAGAMRPAMEILGPDDHVRLFFPDPETGVLSLPRQGDGRLHWPQDPPAVSRVYTPRAFDPTSGELVLDFVLHGHGVAGTWAAETRPGDRIHIAGPKSSRLVAQAERYLLLGDETALPAIANWLDMLPASARIEVHVLITNPAARQDLPAHAGAQIFWHDYHAEDIEAFARLVDTPDPDRFIWAAGERAAMTVLQQHLAALDHPRRRSDLSNYWTLGEAEH